MADSILNDVKQALGLAADYTPYDAEITMHINSVFGDLNQLGLGPEAGYSIVNASDEWSEFIGTEARYNGVRSYVFLKVKMLFDPPTLGYLITANEKVIEKMEWRLNVAREDIDHPMPDPTPEVSLEDGFATGQITSY